MSTVLERPATPRPAGSLLRPEARLVPWLALAAVVLRLALFLGRGNYLAFDEAWYLILGRNLWSGHGYTMGGLRQTVLSPLFPIVAGGVGRAIGSEVWGGRIVAALAAGLLVLPCWSVFRRLAGQRTALLACALVAVLPSLAPFVAPELVGWDLWVGAGPLGQLFALTGIALLLAGLDARMPLRWTLAGGAFALAYLDRPEMLVLGVLAAGAAALVAGVRGLRRSVPGLLGCALAFAVVAAPYLLYLHDTVGHWTLTGRAINVSAEVVRQTAQGYSSHTSATVEQMLWGGDKDRYAEELYGLAPSDTRMANAYWGVPPANVQPPVLPPLPAEAAAAAAPVATGPTAAAAAAAAQRRPAPVRRPSRLERADFFRRALGIVLVWPLWPFALAGALIPGRRRYRRELAALAPFFGTALVIAVITAVDPRTQVVIAPVLAWYAARGLTLLAARVQRGWRGAVRRDFAFVVVAGTAVAVLLGIDAYRLWRGTMQPSIRQVIADGNREVAQELARLTPPDETVMSWTPALSAWARRDWRPLPTASLPRVLRFAAVTHTRWIVFSTLNPSPVPREQMPRAFLVARVLPGEATAGRWRIRVVSLGPQHAVGELAPDPAAAAPAPGAPARPSPREGT